MLCITKTINTLRRNDFAVSTIVSIFALPVLFIYIWLSNRAELFHGISHSEYNLTSKSLINNLSNFDKTDHLLVLSPRPIDEVFFSYLLINFKNNIPSLASFSTIDDSLFSLMFQLYETDVVWWLNPSNNTNKLNPPEPIYHLLSITNLHQLGESTLLRKYFIDNHMFFIRDNFVLEKQYTNLIKNPTFDNNLDSWFLPDEKDSISVLNSNEVKISNLRNVSGLGIYQEVFVKSGSWYRFSCLAKSNNQIPRFNIKDKNGKKIGKDLFFFNSTDDWEYLTSFVRAKKSENIYLFLSCGKNSNGSCFFKNPSFIGISCDKD